MARKHPFSYVLVLALSATIATLAEAAKGGSRKSEPTPPPSTSPATEGTVVDVGGYPNAVAVDDLGRPCTAYFVGRELRFAHFDGASWRIQSLGLVGGDYGATTIDMAIDAFDHPAIVYSVLWEGGVQVSRISVASFDGTAWKVETVDLFGGSPTIAYGPSGSVAVAYFKNVSDGTVLRLAERSGSGWQYSTVESGNVAGGFRQVLSPSIAVDGFGNLGISYGFYISGVSRQLRYAYRSAGIWRMTTLWYDVPLVTQLAFDSGDRPRIAFWASAGGLRVSSRDGSGIWSSALLPWQGTGRAGQISLGLDSSGSVHITAYDTGGGDLYLISGGAGQFTSQVLANAGSVGKSNSLQVDQATDTKFVTFSDQTSGRLMFTEF